MATHIDIQIPCIIDRGIVFNKKDMIRVLQGLDQVEYMESVDGRVSVKREGFIVEIFEDPTEATIFFNRRLHINVNSFEYLKIHYSADSTEETNIIESDLGSEASAKRQDRGNYSIELVMPGRVIILRPTNDPIDNPTTLIAEVEERRRTVASWEEVVAESEDD